LTAAGLNCDLSRNPLISSEGGGGRFLTSLGLANRAVEKGGGRVSSSSGSSSSSSGSSSSSSIATGVASADSSSSRSVDRRSGTSSLNDSEDTSISPASSSTSRQIGVCSLNAEDGNYFAASAGNTNSDSSTGNAYNNNDIDNRSAISQATATVTTPTLMRGGWPPVSSEDTACHSKGTDRRTSDPGVIADAAFTLLNTSLGGARLSDATNKNRNAWSRRIAENTDAWREINGGRDAGGIGNNRHVRQGVGRAAGIATASASPASLATGDTPTSKTPNLDALGQIIQCDDTSDSKSGSCSAKRDPGMAHETSLEHRELAHRDLESCLVESFTDSYYLPLATHTSRRLGRDAQMIGGLQGYGYTSQTERRSGCQTEGRTGRQTERQTVTQRNRRSLSRSLRSRNAMECRLPHTTSPPISGRSPRARAARLRIP
jgi:hypothetical protein